MDIVTLFYDFDKFAVGFAPRPNQPLLEDGKVHRNRHGQMCLSEVMTILVLFHGSTDIVAGLIAYTYREKLPSLNLREEKFTASNDLRI